MAYLVIAVTMTSATPERVRTTLPQNLGDPALVTWIMSWQAHALVNEPGSWFDGNMFHPSGQALGYSELLLPLVPPFAAVYGLTGNPVLAHNTVLLALLVLSLVATHALGRRLGLAHAASAFAALGFTFGAFTFAHLGHLQLLTFGFFPVALLALDGLHRRRRVRDGVLLGVASAALVTACLYYGVIWLTWLGLAGFVHMALNLRQRRTGWLPPLVAAAATTAVLLLPVVVLLLQFQQDVGFERPLDEGAGLSASDLLAPAPGSYLYRSAAQAMIVRPMASEHTFFPGVLLGASAVVGLVAAGRAVPAAAAAWRARRLGVRPGEELWLVLGVGGLAALVIAAGPSAFGLPAPFRLLHEFAPGFDSIRVPARLAVPAMLALALVAGRGLEVVSAAVNVRVTILAAVAMAATAAELAAPFPRVDALPGDEEAALYDAVEQLPPGAVVELPAAGSTAGVAGVYEESERLLYSIGTWRSRFNGTSGGTPPEYFARADVLNRFPDPASLELLEELRLDHVILRVSADGGPFRFTPTEAARRVAALPPGAVVREIPGGYAVEPTPSGPARP